MRITNKEKKYVRILSRNENKWIAVSEDRSEMLFADSTLPGLLKKLRTCKARASKYVVTKVKPAGRSYISCVQSSSIIG